MQRSEHADGADRGASKLGGDVVGDRGKTQNVDVQHLSGTPHGFEILAAEVPQTKIETAPSRGLLHHIRMAFELVADCGSDEVGAVGVKSFAHHQVDLTEIDIAEIEGDFLAVSGLGPEFPDITCHLFHPHTI